jgi:HAD superfamily hydrolase (TIGR01490 family)
MSAAFFDIDETLITVPSIFRFLAFDMEARGRSRTEYELSARAVRAPAGREARMRAYARLFAGREEAELAERGERWLESELRRGPLFHPSVLAAFEHHGMAGNLRVLVSGSIPACVDPIARRLDADLAICSRPEVRDGRYTGELRAPMIGTAKAAAVRAEVAARGLALGDCWAYGDHASDLPVLELVGVPVVVANDPILNRVAASRGWPQLPPARPVPASRLEAA